MRRITEDGDGARRSFRQVLAAFLAQPGLPFAEVLSAERVERIFAKQGHLFGTNAVYSTAVMVWSFLGQVLWKGFHAQLVDGFTFTMPDTASNQAAYPHPRSQKTGVGLPIARATAILSLATASVMDFLMIALLWSRRVQVCARRHQKRHVDFRRGGRLGKQDHLIVWTKPARPDGMDEATDDALPGELVLRELRFQVVEPGRRTRELTIVTTLTDAKRYSKADLAELYGFRWNAEVYHADYPSSAGLYQLAA